MNTHVSALAEAGKSPFIVEYIMVLCSGLLFMAYVDPSGKWRHAYDNLELPGPVRVLW